ncbi:hypothetical protein [Pseudomonas entomophila]|uniref:Uncharacterized protein n=2 Tax=Pseudomonas entomophila TaxID=312306 RepID=Q1IFK1_PSEE4|nr:hypothetical protein [Pseudomonas entomophila]WMW05611.1 hypothetical protein RAH46_25370 [Pseudomonas entomophila]CAK13553.1 conserved hypothetical protein [Pseudomonas entomophila L48]
MLLLVSGEGVSDIGGHEHGQQGLIFTAGPMTHVIDRLVEHRFDYSLLQADSVEFVHKSELVAAKAKNTGRMLRAPGKRREQETRYYYENAQRLALKAVELGARYGGPVIPVLFRDADTLSSSSRNEWQAKWQSMLDGFESGGSVLGIPMLPKPKSEAWLLCACRQPPYQHCAGLEDESGNDDAPEPLKRMLSDACDGQSSAAALVGFIVEGAIDPLRIQMPSFDAFRERLSQVLDQI